MSAIDLIANGLALAAIAWAIIVLAGDNPDDRGS